MMQVVTWQEWADQKYEEVKKQRVIWNAYQLILFIDMDSIRALPQFFSLFFNLFSRNWKLVNLSLIPLFLEELSNL